MEGQSAKRRFLCLDAGWVSDDESLDHFHGWSEGTALMQRKHRSVVPTHEESRSFQPLQYKMVCGMKLNNQRSNYLYNISMGHTPNTNN